MLKIKRYTFYCPSSHSRIIESVNVFFFEDTKLVEVSLEINEQQQIVLAPIVIDKGNEIDA